MSINKGKLIFWSVVGAVALVGTDVGVNFYRANKKRKEDAEAERLATEAEATKKETKGSGYVGGNTTSTEGPKTETTPTPGRPNTSIKAVYATGNNTKVYRMTTVKDWKNDDKPAVGTAINKTIKRGDKIGYLVSAAGPFGASYYTVAINQAGTTANVYVPKGTSEVK